MREVEVLAPDGHMRLTHVLSHKKVLLATSASEARRKIIEGAVRVDGARVENLELSIQAGTEHVYSIGKRRFAKVRLVC